MRKNIQELLYSRQIRTYGFGEISDFMRLPYQDMKTAISFAVRLSEPIMDAIAEGPTHEYFHHYRTVNRHLDETALALTLMLQQAGHRAMPVAASQSINREMTGSYQGLFSHRLAATRAGLGWIGKNNSLVTFDFGPRVRLGTVLTDWVTDCAAPIEKSYCGDCSLCVDLCPALALSGSTWHAGLPRETLVDVVACSRHMKTHYQSVGRGAVCGICLSCCPVGRER